MISLFEERLKLQGVGTLLLFTFATLAVAVPAAAEEETDSDDDWGEDDWGEEPDDVGFADLSPTEASDEDESETEEPQEIKEPSPFSITGFLRSDWGLWVERFKSNPFAKGRQSLDLNARYKTSLLRIVAAGHAEYDFAYLYERSSYDEPTLEAYEWQVAVRDSYIGLTTSHVDITAGWQTVPWGVGELFSKVDVTNPRDLREPGLSDLEDIRLPVLSTRIGLFFGYHRFEAMAVHESFFGYKSPPFGPFSPLPAMIPEDAADFLANNSARWHETPKRFDIHSQQFFLRWTYKGPGVDLALYGASVLDQTGVYDIDFAGLLNDIYAMNSLEVEVDHPRYAMVGHSGAWPVSDWIFKWELAADLERAYNVGDADAAVPEIGVERANAIGGLVSVNYQGIDNTLIWVEFGKSWLLEDVPELLFPAEEPTVGIVYRQTALKDDLTIQLRGVIFGWSAAYGWLGSVQANYVIVDGLDLGLGYITYHPGSEFGLMSGFDRHDRLYLKLRWDFTIY